MANKQDEECAMDEGGRLKFCQSVPKGASWHALQPHGQPDTLLNKTMRCAAASILVFADTLKPERGRLE
jgi:hypothetical protein